jgi:hypothetical protein
MTDDAARSAHSSGRFKKEYRVPRLIVYGDIREITQNVGQMGSGDVGGTLPNVKTQP